MREEVRALLRLAWPVVLGTLGFRLLSVVALFVLGGLGEDALAAIGAASTYSIALLIVAIGVLQGFDPLFSQAHGAGDGPGLGRALVRAVALCFLMAAPLTWAHLNAEPALRWLGQPEAVVPAAAAWCRSMAYAVLPSLFFFALRGFLIGQGRTLVPTLAITLANGVNLAGHLAFVRDPGLSVERALQLSGACTAAVYLVLPLSLVALAPGAFRPALGELRRAFDLRAQLGMVGLGLPAGLQLGLEVWAFNVTTLLVGHLGTSFLAGHTVALNLSSIAFMVPLGLGVAASARVGNLIGAGRAWQGAAKTALLMGLGFALCSAAVFTLFPRAMSSVYSADPKVIAVAVSALPFTALFQVFDATQAISFGVLRGAGDLRLPAVVNLIGYWCIGVPVGYTLAFHTSLGFVGVWIGLTLGLLCVMGALLVRVALVSRRVVRRTQVDGQGELSSATLQG